VRPATRVNSVTDVLLSTDPGVVFLLLGVWTWAGLKAAALPYAVHARGLRRRAGLVLTLTAAGLALVALRAALVVVLGQSGWWFVQEKVVLALPLLVVPAAATVVWTVPRLLRVRRAARAFPDVVPPSLRQEAGHPLMAWPVQLSALGALAGGIVLFFVSYPATAGSSFAVSVAVGLAALVGWQRLRARHTRLGGSVVFASRWSRRARSAGVMAGVVVAAVVGPLAALAIAAPTADAHADTGHGLADLGGGAVESTVPGVGVGELRGRFADGPVRRFTITARHAPLTRPDGSTVDALTYDGTVPGPELRVTEGDQVEVTLHNGDIADGVTIHWHGYDVPNGEDGVAGVTQDAVPVGGSFVYRFVARQVGTYWYHSHQSSYEQVAAGLFGVLIVAPKSAPPNTVDIAVPYHRDVAAATQSVSAGQLVRLRIVNADNDSVTAVLRGAVARLVAVDGTDLIGPTLVTNPALRIAAGGRADFEFTMPAGPVGLELHGRAALTLGAGGPPDDPVSIVDLMSYGTPGPTPFTDDFDREFTLVLDQKVARVAGVPMMAYTVNGNAYPEIPAQLVRFGDRVKFTIVSRGYGETHPIHPHGHHVLVLSRNGVRSTGSPLWMDTFEVRSGEVWEVAMRADNPGIWMDHCHNLRHAAEGMMFHLRYEGVSTPFRTAGMNHAE
jgi:FtsP/CotA-like multicopper oxidase with cupredoxin domain